MTNSLYRKFGRRKAKTWGRVHGPSKGNTKRVAAKACRRLAKKQALVAENCDA